MAGLNAQDAIDKYFRGNSNFENNYCQQLRGLPEAEKLQIIKEILPRYHHLGLELSKRCLHNRECFELLVENSLQADVSSIKMWLKYIIPQYGMAKTLKEIYRHIKKERPYRSSALAGVIYWMKSSDWLITTPSKEDEYVKEYLFRAIKRLGIS